MNALRWSPAALLLACAGSSTNVHTSTHTTVVEPTTVEHRELVVTCYEGTTTVTSPDGATPYGAPAPVVVRRTVSPSEGTISEHVVSPGEEHPTTLTRVDDSNVFQATDDGNTFSGTLTFEGPEWEWTSWTYDISMTDGSGALRGTGRLEGNVMENEKIFAGPEGDPQARITEHLEQLDHETCETRLREVLAMPAPTPPEG